MKKHIFVKSDEFKLLEPFKIAHGTRLTSETIYVKVTEGEFVGEGEGFPYARYDEDIDSSLELIKSQIVNLEQVKDLKEIDSMLPAGAARNAVVNAFWDLECKKQGKNLWELLGVKRSNIITTAYTLVIDDPDRTAERVSNLASEYPLLKVKLAGDGLDLERIRKVRAAAKNNDIIVDANESFSPEFFKDSLAEFVKLDVKMIEQPFRQGEDEILREINSPIVICADESCHTSRDLPLLKGKYQMINIKLDKTGGLTEALRLFREARKAGFLVMVGCMVSSSLGIEPAFALAAEADLVDIDAPLLLAENRKSKLLYTKSRVSFLQV